MSIHAQDASSPRIGSCDPTRDRPCQNLRKKIRKKNLSSLLLLNVNGLSGPPPCLENLFFHHHNSIHQSLLLLRFIHDLQAFSGKVKKQTFLQLTSCALFLGE